MSENKKTQRNTKEKFVKTIQGEELPISKCRKYDSGFYKIGDTNIENSGDCYLMDNGSYYRVETENIVYDHNLKKYVFNIRENNLLKGFINKNLDLGYFSKNINTIMINDIDCKKAAISEDIFIGNYNYRERIDNGEFYHISKLKANRFTQKSVPSQELKHSLPYDSKDVLSKATEVYDKVYTFKEQFDQYKIQSIIKDYTFGLEFETTKGIVPKQKAFNLGLIPLRDGSISGLEYVTIPLSGSKGIHTIVDTVKELNKRTDFDDKCALHFHIGNIPRTPEFILAFFKITCAIQDDIFKMFNIYKKYNFGYKNKNYAAPYPVYHLLSKMDAKIDKNNLMQNFDILFQHLSGGYKLEHFGRTLDDVNAHPLDPNAQAKWNIHSRYYIHNLIPIIFGNKKTIEFRIHTPTYEIDKILWFLFFNCILIDYVKNNTQSILENKSYITLTDIVDSHLSKEKVDYQFTHDFLNYYYQRVKNVEQFHRQSKIFFNEEDLNCCFDYDSLLINNNKNSLSFKDIRSYQDMPKFGESSFDRAVKQAREQMSIYEKMNKEQVSIKKDTISYKKPVRKYISFNEEDLQTETIPTAIPTPAELRSKTIRYQRYTDGDNGVTKDAGGQSSYESFGLSYMDFNERSEPEKQQDKDKSGDIPF